MPAQLPPAIQGLLTPLAGQSAPTGSLEQPQGGDGKGHSNVGKAAGLDHEPFLPAEDGPFECDDCQFFTAPNQCRQPNMIQLYGPADPGADYTSGPDGKVAEKACCDWFTNKSQSAL